MKKKVSLFLALVLMCYVCMPAAAAESPGIKTIDGNGNVVFKTDTLPDWLPDDAPDPAPGAEISIVHWQIDENGNAVIYDPQLRNTVVGTHGTAAIYPSTVGRIYWGVTSRTGGWMIFTGYITHTVNGRFYNSYPLGSIEFDGSCDGEINGKMRGGENKYTLSGAMVSGNGLSFTLPDVSTSVYVYT